MLQKRGKEFGVLSRVEAHRFSLEKRWIDGELLQLGVFGFRLLEDGEVGVGVFPETARESLWAARVRARSASAFRANLATTALARVTPRCANDPSEHAARASGGFVYTQPTLVRQRFRSGVLAKPT
jgi:hypothetical protein